MPVATARVTRRDMRRDGGSGTLTLVRAALMDEPSWDHWNCRVPSFHSSSSHDACPDAHLAARIWEEFQLSRVRSSWNSMSPVMLMPAVSGHWT